MMLESQFDVFPVDSLLFQGSAAAYLGICHRLSGDLPPLIWGSAAAYLSEYDNKANLVQIQFNFPIQIKFGKNR